MTEQTDWILVRGAILECDDDLEVFRVRSEIDGKLYVRSYCYDYSALGEAAEKDWVEEGDRIEYYAHPSELVNEEK